MRALGNLLTAMVTPFAGDMSVDYGRAGELAEMLVSAGSDGVVVAGTTGESPTLTHEEKLGLLEVVLDRVGDRATVVAGTGTNSTRDSVALTREAEKAGAHAVMAVVPYYNKPPQSGLYEHFRAIAASTSLPVILYNVPGRTGTNMTADTTLRLAAIENIAAVKEASGSLDQASEIARGARPGFLLYSGDDSLTLPMLAVGGHGVVSVASHVAGGDIKRMILAHLAGRVREATAIHHRLFPLFKAMFVTTNPIPVKAALRLAGFPVGGVRPPLVAAGEREEEEIGRVLRELGMI